VNWSIAPRALLLLFLLTVAAACQSLECRPCDRQAARLLRLYGLDLEDHQIQADNVALYLFNLAEPLSETAWQSAETFTAFLAQRLEHWRRVEARQGSREEQVMAQDHCRWYQKLHKDLLCPYTDREVLQRLERVEQDMQAEDALWRARLGPRRYIVFGGLLKGRYGGNSDVDYLVDMEGLTRAEALQVTAGRESTVKAQPQLRENFQEKFARLQAGTPSMRLLDEDQPWRGLRDLIVDCLQSKGFELNFDLGTVVRRFYPPPTRDEGWL
jgi:predicted nucleotidyltransferase